MISEPLLSTSFRIFCIKQPKKYTQNRCAFRPRFDWKRTMMGNKIKIEIIYAALDEKQKKKLGSTI